MLALIPARGGSKGIPGKNIKMLAGHPLIAYSIMAAQQASHVDRIVVSTDDEKIAEVAMEYGAEVPFLRPAELATDNAKVIDAFIYTIDRLNETANPRIENFVCLQPTSPLRTAANIDAAIDMFFEKKAYSCGTMTEAKQHFTRYKRIEKDGRWFDYFPNVDNSLNRQERETLYINDGTIAIFNYEVLKTNYSYINDRAYAYILKEEESADVDTMLDFEFVEFLLMKRRNT